MAESANYRILEPAEVERIVRRFMAMPLQEIKQYQTAGVPTADCFTDAIIAVENLDKNKTPYMDFMDIFCLIEQISENLEYESIMDDGATRTPQMFKIFHYRMLMIYLRNAYDRSIPVKLFLALPVKSFYAFLESVSCSKEMNTEYDCVKGCIQSIMKNFNENTSTIKQVLDAVSGALQKAWCPTSIQITSYQRMILEAYGLLGRLLIGSFKMAFKHRFNVEYVKEKYEPDYP